MVKDATDSFAIARNLAIVRCVTCRVPPASHSRPDGALAYFRSGPGLPTDWLAS